MNTLRCDPSDAAYRFEILRDPGKNGGGDLSVQIRLGGTNAFRHEFAEAGAKHIH